MIFAAIILADRRPGNADIIEISEEGPFVLRWWDQLDCDLGDNRQGSFAADQQILESVAGDVFDAFAASAQQAAIRQNAFEGHDVIAGDAVLEAAQATGVFHNIAAEG